MENQGPFNELLPGPRRIGLARLLVLKFRQWHSKGPTWSFAGKCHRGSPLQLCSLEGAIPGQVLLPQARFSDSLPGATDWRLWGPFPIPRKPAGPSSGTGLCELAWQGKVNWGCFQELESFQAPSASTKGRPGPNRLGDAPQCWERIAKGPLDFESMRIKLFVRDTGCLLQSRHKRCVAFERR